MKALGDTEPLRDQRPKETFVFLLVLMKGRKFWESIVRQKKEAEVNILSRKTLPKPVHPASSWPLCGGDKDAPLLQGQGLPYPCGFYDLLQGKTRESFLHLPFFKFLLLKMFNVERCHIFGLPCSEPHSHS